MSAGTGPITPEAFAAALPALPLSTLHLKNLEVRNSIAHLDYSNAELRRYVDDQDASDTDCEDAIAENETVIARMQARLALLKTEIERRGLSWAAFLEASGFDAAKEDEERSAAQQLVAARAAAGRAAAAAGEDDDDDDDEPDTNGTAHVNGTDTNGTATLSANGNGVVNGNGHINGASTSESASASPSAARAASVSSTTQHTSNPWTDGTFVTGSIVNGRIVMTGPSSQPATPTGPSSSGPSTRGGAASRTSDEDQSVSAHSTHQNGGEHAGMADELLRQRMAERLSEMEMNDDDDGLHL